MRLSELIILTACFAFLASCIQDERKQVSGKTAEARLEKEIAVQVVGVERRTWQQPVSQASDKNGQQNMPEKFKSNSTKLEQSLQRWNQLKAECGGNYSYKVGRSSWTGFRKETVIIVRNNKVTERRYREWSGMQMPAKPNEFDRKENRSWAEQGDSLGSHDEGAPLKTLDQLYEEAGKILDEKLEAYQRLMVGFDNQGLLRSCFYLDTRIADDAPQIGVAINSIELADIEN